MKFARERETIVYWTREIVLKLYLSIRKIVKTTLRTINQSAFSESYKDVENNNLCIIEMAMICSRRNVNYSI